MCYLSIVAYLLGGGVQFEVQERGGWRGGMLGWEEERVELERLVLHEKGR